MPLVVPKLKHWVVPGIFALAVISATAAFWGNLPTTQSKIAITCITAVVVITIFRKSSHDLLRTFLVAYAALFSSILFAQGLIQEYAIVILYGCLIFFVGLLINSLQTSTDDFSVVEWLITCLVSSQLFGLYLFWPISYFNRTLLVVVTFYIVWRFTEYKQVTRQQIVLHFVFTGLIAIVVLGGIIWANFPHLLP